jgi:UDP-2,3-diacylglucosamine pyrophosphatase LpxH/DNA-directed RNA polymerase subunit RPC12/RpoP
MSTTNPTCPKCSSNNTVINKKSTGQYLCKDCRAYFTLNNTKIEVECFNCKEKTNFNGRNRYITCPKCEFKLFVREDNKAVDPYTLDQGLGILNLNFTPSEERLRIIPFGDLHIGAPRGQCNIEKAKRELEYVMNTPDTYLLGMGDLMDCAQKMPWSKGPNLFASSLKPMEQLSELYQILKPLADKGKILGLLTGNHEEWIMNTTGIQVTSLLCKQLGVPYLGAACDINIQIGEQEYTFYALHGSGNAQLKHTKLGRLINCSKDIFADALIMGHVHQLAVTKGGKYMHGDTSKAYYILTGHFLNWIGSYAQAFGMDVCPSGCPKITIFSDRKDIHVTI